uniref:Kinesin motor domain-containing protein n=1 Tax=Heterorhabditis bacteriophora TaxID=37862 RepID=A0A1I7WVD1_HETBA
MIAHVTAASGHYEETYNTLVYASRAKNITNKVQLEHKNMLISLNLYTSIHLTMNRPASADQPYTDAMREIRREYERRAIPHASSSNHKQLKLTNRRRTSGSTKVGFAGTTTRTQSMVVLERGGLKGLRTSFKGDRRDFSSLFNQLKEQYITLSDKQQKLRERLMKANQDSYEIDMSRASKLAIIGAWEKQHQADKSAESIDRLKKDVIELVSMIMQKTDNSMSKLPKYEMLAEKLIEGRLDDKDREQLEQEYRIVKNQFHYHLIPLKNIQTVVSWNSMLLPKINSLPIIVKGREKERDSEGTDSYDGGSEPTPESPLSIHLPPLK